MSLKIIDGQVQTHVLKNLCDYSLNYNANNNFKDYTVGAMYLEASMAASAI